MMDFEKQKKLNKEHAKNPVPGDFWHEMLCGICVVLDVTPTKITICREKKDIGNDSWAWDLAKTKTMTRSKFHDWLSYGTRDGYWANVRPESHKSAVKEYKNNNIKRSHSDKPDYCPGKVYRARVNAYVDSRGVYVYQEKMVPMKKLSCPGCKRCKFLLESIQDFIDRGIFPRIQDIKNGTLYKLIAENSPWSWYLEFKRIEERDRKW